MCRDLVLRYYPGIRLEELTETKKKPSIRTARLQAEIWTRDLPNTKQECKLNHDVLCLYLKMLRSC
jgi:hypothetical protein